MTLSYDVKIEDIPDEFRGIAEIIGLENALKLVKKYSGAQFYIPKSETITRQAKYRQMFDDFKIYRDYGRVARKHNLSVSHTRQIIKDEKKRRYPARPIELSLF